MMRAGLHHGCTALGAQSISQKKIYIYIERERSLAAGSPIQTRRQQFPLPKKQQRKKAKPPPLPHIVGDQDSNSQQDSEFGRVLPAQIHWAGLWLSHPPQPLPPLLQRPRQLRSEALGICLVAFSTALPYLKLVAIEDVLCVCDHWNVPEDVSKAHIVEWFKSQIQQTGMYNIVAPDWPYKDPQTFIIQAGCNLVVGYAVLCISSSLLIIKHQPSFGRLCIDHSGEFGVNFWVAWCPGQWTNQFPHKSVSTLSNKDMNQQEFNLPQI
ncbi:uncharacterized protein [Elaeis guineensis]|uniref:uncharacterized protein isoform X2 n=1 Tax=Elaeis guineensis var. tenera TaxID=51953 RepID=UPI003C6DB73D